MRWLSCHSLRNATPDRPVAFCAHPLMRIARQQTTPEICRACRLRSQPPPDHFRASPNVRDPLVSRGQVELVVAKYREDVSWLEKYQGLDCLVYDKGDPAAEYPLPNVGREAHTYLHHIITRYDRLADVTVFLQGDPHFHCADLEEKIWSVGRDVGFQDLSDAVLVEDHRGAPIHPGLPLREKYETYFGSPGPEYYASHTAACFAVSREDILARPRRFYEDLLEDVVCDPNGPYWMERLWRFAFERPQQRRGLITAADAGIFRDLQFLIYSFQGSQGYPLIVYDLGLTPQQRAWCEDQPLVRCVPFRIDEMPFDRFRPLHLWQTWLKPFYFLKAPFDQMLWIDADCCVLRDVEEAFAIIERQPLVVRDATSVRTENDPRLYTELPIPADRKTGGVVVNAGVVGLCRHRDRALLNAWAFGVDWAARQPGRAGRVAWMDQGMLLWAA